MVVECNGILGIGKPLYSKTPGKAKTQQNGISLENTTNPYFSQHSLFQTNQTQEKLAKCHLKHRGDQHVLESQEDVCLGNGSIMFNSFADSVTEPNTFNSKAMTLTCVMCSILHTSQSNDFRNITHKHLKTWRFSTHRAFASNSGLVHTGLLVNPPKQNEA